jgi:hypothetical protein
MLWSGVAAQAQNRATHDPSTSWVWAATSVEPHLRGRDHKGLRNVSAHGDHQRVHFVYGSVIRDELASRSWGYFDSA